MSLVSSAMKCPNAETLRALLEGRLDGEPEASLVAHVEQCSDCQQHLERLTCPVPDDTMTIGQKQVWGCVFTPKSDDPDTKDISGKAAETASGGVPKAGVSSAESLPDVPGYDLLEVIGRGGMGVVYRGRHRKLDREVAVKTIPLTGRQAGRSEREILAAGRLQHPNIVQTHDAGETDSVAWIVMELLNGDHLGQLMESWSGSDRETPSFNTIADYIRQAAEGLQEVHDAGLVHRDVKPSNLMVTSDGQVKLLDLGLVTCGGDVVDGSITDETTIMGSFDYIAPEQGRDAMSADHRADIYGLGCSLFALLTGRPPFSGAQFRNASQKLIAHACEPRPRARDFNPDVPSALAQLAQRMMSIEPAERPQSAREVASALAQFCGGASGTTERKWTAAASFGGLILALGIIITIKLNSGKTITIESDEPVTSIRMENTESGDVASISIESSQSAMAGRQPSSRSVEEQQDGVATLDIKSLSAKYSHHLRTIQHSTLTGFCFGPNNDEVFTCGEDGRILRWSLASTGPKEILQTDGLPITGALTVTNDGSAIIYSTKGILWKWNRKTRKHDWQCKSSTIALSTLPDSDYFVGLHSAHADVTQIRSVGSGEAIRQTVTNRVRVLPYIAKDLEHVLCASPASDNVVFKTIASKSKGNKYRAFEANDFTPRYAAFDRAEQKIIALDGDGTTVVWTRSPNKILRRKKDVELSRTHLIPLCESEQFLSVEGLTQLIIWNPIDGSVDRKIDVRPVKAIQVSNDGRMALTDDPVEGLAHLWDLADGSSASATTATRPTAAVAGLPTEPLNSTEGLPKTAGNIDGGGDLQSAKGPGSGDPRTAGNPRTAESEDSFNWPADGPNPATLPFSAKEAVEHQQAWAKHLACEPRSKTERASIELQLIPPGEFLMGATEDDIEELVTETKKILQSHYKYRREEALRSALPRHTVRITQPFLMSRCEITIDQFCQVTGSDLETAALWLARVDKDRRADPDIGLHPAHTKWIDAIHFCNRLSNVEGLSEYYAIEEKSVTPLHNEGFRLPTEAEWEFAARSGSYARIWMDGVHTKISDYAFYRGRSSRTLVECGAVGQKLPNGFGLYDMFGNMGEWCFDFYSEKYYTNSTQTGPMGPQTGPLHVRRGSGHDSYVFNIGAWIRSFGQSQKSAGAIRVVRTLKRTAEDAEE